MESICGVYAIRRKGTNKRYIGSSLDCATRWKWHLAALKRKAHTSRYLQRSWDKYGPEAFVFEIVEVCDPECRIDREQHYLDTTKCQYNFSKQAAGGRVIEGYHHTESAKSQIGAASKAWWETHEASDAQRTIGRDGRSARGRANSPANKPGWVPEHRIGVKDTPATIEQRRASRLATEADRREQGLQYVWITNGTNDQKILSTDAVPEGWRIGRKPSFAENARTNRSGERRDDESRENMRQAQLATNAARRASGEAHHNAGVQQAYCWLTDGVTNLRQLKTAPIPDGFRRGRTLSK